MRRPLLGAISAGVLAAGLVAAGGPSIAQPPDGPPPGATPAAESYIVVYEGGVRSQSKTVDLEREHGIAAERRFNRVFDGFSARMPEAVRDRLAKDPDVAFVAPDREVRAVPASEPIVPGDSVPTGARRIEAASSTAAMPASTVGVAVVDSGIDLAHPDLTSVAGVDCTTSGGTSQDANGHGTHVAGTIGARNNGSGTIGVAPGTTLFSVKVLDQDGVGSFSQVICGIDWITANAATLGIKVANLSLSGEGSNDNNCGNSNNDALHLAICRSTDQGITYVAAAGNEDTGFGSSVPAAYPEVLTVTAMADSDGAPGGNGGRPSCDLSESDDSPATFSNYAVSTIDKAHVVAAPGACIASTRLGGGTRVLSGTSMAAPHVAGVVALCHGSGGVAGPCDGLSPAQIIDLVRADAQARAASYGFTGDPRNSPGTQHYGYLVDAEVTATGEPGPDPEPEPEPEPEPCIPSGSGGC
ncbi:S8 family serine peptidase [Lolliginicoccus levis]|uniref:S8 family serine peptidase n=1 Tax=Lolliginicoccus levis TaxID=2919542 RepID=UPI00241E352C|nr:S8 family serine peptidase [Lolliginicoccus levis]